MQNTKFYKTKYKDLKSDVYHNLYMCYDTEKRITYIVDADGETIIFGDNIDFINALRNLLNFECEEISKQEFEEI